MTSCKINSNENHIREVKQKYEENKKVFGNPENDLHLTPN